MRRTRTFWLGARLLYDGWVRLCFWKTIMVMALTLFFSFFPMGRKANLGFAASVTSRTFTLGLTERYSIKRAYWRALFFTGPIPLWPTRASSYAARSYGSW